MCNQLYMYIYSKALLFKKKNLQKHNGLFESSIHPRYKHDVAYRLYLAALGVAYHQRGVEFEGPFPTSAVIDSTHRHLTIEYDRGLAPIEVRSSEGFEVLHIYLLYVTFISAITGQLSHKIWFSRTKQSKSSINKKEIVTKQCII